MTSVIDVLEPATATALTTVETVIEELGLGEQDQAGLARRIDAASDAIREFCGRSFERARYRELVRSYGTARLMLTHTPLVTIHEVLMDNEPVSDYLIDKPDAGILWRRDGWRWSARMSYTLARTPLVGWEDCAVSVDYTAGYFLPGQEGRNLPYDIEQACIITVRSWHLGRARDPNVGEKRVGDLAIRYRPSFPTGTVSQAIPDEAITLLRPYKRNK